ncbi:wax ester/triacylglycerol synthase family O-acyltransferase [Nocardioides sp. zg-579]|uniref:Diacylglycerol O-acyltransferase n=1 Tax=Nocardioides marmotae TaxID=2663857 RepID=A0A6I3J9C9_9ACTN|nr:wax ester/triacylglycerol synthase family O-acyltransferase [Nocardioides marmotae]MCR6030654.1 wax ester/triacylglycerol synthase family O-acyltransferase [Gordonia jinghuaiqii]MTB94290.1 wax ester/triacylglycerol synthase family O-acyltransferase [Nocardioides marmotae]QKE00565.1 wax ester/triacylglycerol synthase family O-acyltransferase [Nocardioides marmotae]
MNERLRPRDLAILAEETPSAPAHNATVEIFECADSGFDHDRLVELIRDRISFVPRYRQRLQQVPGRFANPIWVDDEHFDLAYHVRRSALPRPGTHDQLRELVGRIVSRPLDRTRPLWEMYLVEGLAGGRVALLSKAHQVLVDGVETVDLGQLLLDVSPEPKLLGADPWQPRPRPSSAALLVEAARDSVTQPRTVLDAARGTTGALLRTGESAAGTAGRVLGGLAGRRPQRAGALGGPLSQQRRVVTVETRLEDYRRVRDVHGGTINDVILATVTGGLRAWLMTRDESLRGFRRVRAVVPVSVIDTELEATSLGSQIAAHYVDLPVGEASPVVRLHQVSYSFQAHKETGRGVAANRLAGIAGFAPTTFHAIGSRLAAREVRRGYQVSVTNVPGPQSALYAAGARMVASYPVHPLVQGHPLAVGVTSYDGGVFYGITADRDQLPDAELLGTCLTEALDELLDTVNGGRSRAPRGRRGQAKPARPARPRGSRP